MIYKKLYILLLLSFLSISLLAERTAVTKQEKELLESVSENYTELSEYLISKGVAVDISDDLGRSLLMHAIQNKNKKLIKLLLEQGADVNYQSMKYSIETRPRFVIDYAIASRDTTIMNLLVDKGAKLDLEDKGQESRVVTAFKDNNLTVVQYLLAKGSKISDDGIRFLILEEMLNSPNSFYDYPVNFWKVKIWDDYGFSIDANSLLSPISLKSVKARKKVVRYISKYKQWLNVANTLSVREKGKRKILQHNGLGYDKPLYSVKLSPSEQDILEEEAIEKTYAKVWIAVIIVLILIGVVFYYRKNIQLWIQSIFVRYRVAPASSNNTRPSSNTSSQPNLTNTQVQGGSQSNHRVDNDTNEVNIQMSEVGKLAVTNRGWVTDDTVDIEVNYLTIEDMINPIRMQNEHERTVREMIWYIRRLERLRAERMSGDILDENLAIKLTRMWMWIDPDNVRIVYKRSLYVLILKHSEQDSNLKMFLERINIVSNINSSTN